MSVRIVTTAIAVVNAAPLEAAASISALKDSPSPPSTASIAAPCFFRAAAVSSRSAKGEPTASWRGSSQASSAGVLQEVMAPPRPTVNQPPESSHSAAGHGSAASTGASGSASSAGRSSVGSAAGAVSDALMEGVRARTARGRRCACLTYRVGSARVRPPAGGT